MPSEIEDGHLQALLVIGGNPMVAFPQPEPPRPAPSTGSPSLAVWDIVASATAATSDARLPVPHAARTAPTSLCPSHLSAVYAQYTPAVVRRAGRTGGRCGGASRSVAQRMGLSILPGGADPDTCTDEDVFAVAR